TARCFVRSATGPRRTVRTSRACRKRIVSARRTPEFVSEVARCSEAVARHSNARSPEKLCGGQPMTDTTRKPLDEATLKAQRESWARGMAPCEHGVADWEECAECRNAVTARKEAKAAFDPAA